jgi:formamidopyrimidine-DNA glycosylase
LHLVGKRVKTVTAQDDASVFGKVGTSGPEVAAAVKGKKVSL